MVEPIVLEFKIDDIYIDNPLLSKNDLLKYDTEIAMKKLQRKLIGLLKLNLIFQTLKNQR